MMHQNDQRQPDLKHVYAHGEGTKRHLIKAAGLMGFLTLCSRVLGMIRDIVSANRFGTTWQWDAFIYAFAIPMFFRRLVGEGALSPAFIPVYTETLQNNGRQCALKFANVTLTFLLVAYAIFLIVAEAFFTGLEQFSFFSPTLKLVFDLLRYFFPYLCLMSLVALGTGVLNSHRHFFTPSLSSIIMDLFWIAGVLWLLPLVGSDKVIQVRWLAFVVLISGFFQLAVQIPPLLKLGYRIQWVWDIASRELRKTFNLLLPSILGFAVVQINLLVDSTLGLMLGAGANSSLWYGNRLMQFPLGIFAVALGTALLPTITTQTVKKDFESAKQTLGFALRATFFIILPSSVGLMVLGKPIIQLLFQHGQFDAVSTSRASAVLICYSIGLVAYACQRIIANGFYAIQDTRTPVRIAVVALLMNIFLNLILMIPLREAGLALATSIAGIYQYIALLWVYHKKVTRLKIKELLNSYIKIGIASAGMGIVAFLVYQCFQIAQAESHILYMAVRLLTSVAAGILVYLALCFILGVEEIHEAVHFIVHRMKKGSQREKN